MSSAGSGPAVVAWAYHKYGGDFNQDFAIETVNKPVITKPTDILVKNYAVSLNPTDDKQRSGFYGASGTSIEPVIGGRDASGVVVAIGDQVTDFKIGDEVYYSGDQTRSGSFSQYTLVDYRIVGIKPKTLTHEQAAAIPLTGITIFQGLYEKLNPQQGKRILITAAAGGVGSLAVQLSKVWGLHVTATASRPDTVAWVKSMGADEVIDHSKKLYPQLGSEESKKFDYIFHCHDDSMFEELVTVIKPRGDIVFLLPFFKDNISSINTAFFASVSIHFEMVFSRPILGFEQHKQGQILNTLAALIDAGKIKSTANRVFQWTDFKQAFQLLVSGKTIGKTVIKVPQ